jgi:GT2 family glycosyltransferase
MKLPCVTIGLVVKNNEETIRNTMNSILLIDYPYDKVEVIAIDGRSKDRTMDVISEMLRHAPFKWKLLSDEGKGLGYARQLVIRDARGKYVIWVDGDHVIPRDYIKKHVGFIEKYSNLAGAGAFVKSPKINVVQTLEEYFWLYINQNRVKRHIKLESVGSAGSIYRVDAIREVGGYDTKIKGAGEDVDLEKRLLERGWKLAMNSSATFTHLMRTSWVKLWKTWFWYGYGAHYTNHKYPNSVNIGPYLPPRATVSGVKLGLILYRITGDLTCFLMTVHKTVKCIAWLFGYSKSHLDGYGHKFKAKL